MASTGFDGVFGSLAYAVDTDKFGDFGVLGSLVPRKNSSNAGNSVSNAGNSVPSIETIETGVNMKAMTAGKEDTARSEYEIGMEADVGGSVSTAGSIEEEKDTIEDDDFDIGETVEDDEGEMRLQDPVKRHFEARFMNYEMVEKLLTIFQSLQRLDSPNKQCILSLSSSGLRIIVKQGHSHGGIQAFVDIDTSEFFREYIVTNENETDNAIIIEVMQGRGCLARGRREGGEV
jgi:hypothetical protein